MARSERLTVGGSEMELYVDEPAGAGPHSAVLVAHHRGALDAFTRKFVEDLARNGYVAAAPLFYHRRPAGEDSMTSLRSLDDGEIVADIAATVDYLRSLDSVRGDAIGIAGHCMGGRLAYLGAAANPAFRACGVFYGGNVMVAWGAGHPPPIERSGDIGCPVIGFFGNDDENPSPDDVARIGAALDRHGKRREFHAYDGAGHAFQNFLNADAYRQGPAEDAWRKLLAFLDRELGPAGRTP